MLLFGPLGLVVPFPAKIRIRVLDPVRFDVPPDQPRYSRSRVMDASEQIRQTIQDAVHDMLRTRRGVWSGSGRDGGNGDRDGTASADHGARQLLGRPGGPGAR